MAEQAGAPGLCSTNANRGVRATVTAIRLCPPAKPKIADFGFEAFDLKPQRTAGGEDKLHNARGRLGFLEADIQEIENERLVSTMIAQARDLENTPEMQQGHAVSAGVSWITCRHPRTPVMTFTIETLG